MVIPRVTPYPEKTAIERRQLGRRSKVSSQRSRCAPMGRFLPMKALSGARAYRYLPQDSGQPPHLSPSTIPATLTWETSPMTQPFDFDGNIELQLTCLASRAPRARKGWGNSRIMRLSLERGGNKGPTDPYALSSLNWWFPDERFWKSSPPH
jgi:hypothetical protein